MSRIAILLIACVSAFGAPTIVHTAQAESDGGTANLSASAISATTGNLIAVWTRLGNLANNITSVTDTAGNTYIPLTKVIATGDDAGQWFYAKNITGHASDVVTVNFDSNPNFSSLVVLEISGLDKTSPLDVDTGAEYSTTTTITSATFSTTFANEIILAGATFNNVSIVATAGTGYTIALQDSRGVSATEYSVVSAIQTSVTATMTISPSARGAFAVVSFKAEATNRPRRRVL